MTHALAAVARNTRSVAGLEDFEDKKRPQKGAELT
jgi:hypothetical protein